MRASQGALCVNCSVASNSATPRTVACQAPLSNDPPYNRLRRPSICQLSAWSGFALSHKALRWMLCLVRFMTTGWGWTAPDQPPPPAPAPDLRVQQGPPRRGGRGLEHPGMGHGSPQAGASREAIVCTPTHLRHRYSEATLQMGTWRQAGPGRQEAGQRQTPGWPP